MPSFINNFAKILPGLVIPLVLLILGMSLIKINITNLKTRLLLGIFKIIIGPIIGLLVVYLLNLDGIVAKVVILQSTMPAAILTFLISSENKSYDQEIGVAFFVSTIASIISIPIILFFLIQ
jgi:predicted permease